ncbi:c-type cytochrome [Fibrella aestuarina]|uniref:C-type cytochrome n=2 Tax=Fibrivirga algicola TaxID=2950420 RepID=A0ABX0QHI7_9BACT|nr:c-type cytochrome [Fibrivirga algicola]
MKVKFDYKLVVMSRLSKFCGALTLAAFLLFHGEQMNAQDSSAAQGGGGPTTATPAPAAAGGGDVAKGKELFTNNCQTCHNVSGEALVGPGLKGVRQRTPGEDWLHKWVRNPAAVIATGDAYAVKIFNQYNKIQMTAFTNLSDGDISSILDYIDSENTPKAAIAGDAVTPAPGNSGGTAAAASSGPSELFTFVLVGLLIVMLLVLGVLLVIVTILSKAVAPQATEGTVVRTTPLVQRIRDGLVGTVNNSTVRSVAIWLFLFVATKMSIDGLYSIGIQQGYAPKQPIAYSHKLHAGQYKIDCNYCHVGVNKGKSATIPSANICMNCHGVIKKESPEIQKIYAAIEQNKPIEWIRVHNLPDLAYFNHAQHVNVGNVQCQSCHGEIQKMEVVEQRSSLTMGWCIDCHRKTEVNTKDNAYYDKLVALHRKETKEPLKVANIGGLECSKCHY